MGSHNFSPKEEIKNFEKRTFQKHCISFSKWPINTCAFSPRRLNYPLKGSATKGPIIEASFSSSSGLLDLRAWTDFEVFRCLPVGEADGTGQARNKKCVDNREKWLGKNYFFGSNSPATKAAQKMVSWSSLENSL